MADSPEELQKHLKLYWIIGAVLFGCTFLTVGVTYINFGSKAADITVGLLIALTKALLVALIFMHLNHEKSLIYTVLLYTFFFFAGMMVLFILALFDPVFFPGFNEK
ncbi:MAG: cytochrome C oxidase subunit IV family protein [Verrucomicrobiota bacterium]